MGLQARAPWSAIAGHDSVDPVIDAEIEYSAVTADGLLREAVFKGLREDREGPARSRTEEMRLLWPCGPGGRIEQPNQPHALILGGLDAVAYSSCTCLYRERPRDVVHVFRQQRCRVGDGLGALEVALELVGKPECHGFGHWASLAKFACVPNR
jgi:hypothetical protein